jgi:hypothetical protein
MFSVSLLCLAGTSTYASTTGTVGYTWALLPYLTAQESWVSQLFDTTYNNVYTFFSKSWLNIIKSNDYQSLVCLGAMTEPSLLLQMQKDKLAIKTSFTKDFLEIKNQLADIEEKNTLQKANNVSLFASWTSYEIEKAKLKDAIDVKVKIHAAIISGFASTYTTKTTEFITNFQQYLTSNATLIQWITSKITKIQNIVNAFALVETTIAKITAKITGIDELSQKIETTKTNGIAALSTTMQSLITNTLKKYKKLQTTTDELDAQKLYIMGQFQLDLDEYLSSSVKNRYDHAKYLTLKNQIKTFSSKFYTSNNQFNCATILNPLDDTTSLMTQIATMNAEVNSWLAKIEKEGVSTTFKTQVYSWFQTEYLKKYKQRYAEYQAYLATYIKTALHALTQSLVPTPPTVPQVTTWSLVSSGEKLPSVVFTKPFNNGEYNIKIKSLQQLMTNLQLYSWAIDGIYNKATKNAVHQFQLSKWLLKGYEKKPATRGWMGPATRAAINKLTK